MTELYRYSDGVRWACVSGDDFEYAIQQGRHGDEFVKLLSGECLRRNSSKKSKWDIISQHICAYGISMEIPMDAFEWMPQINSIKIKKPQLHWEFLND